MCKGRVAGPCPPSAARGSHSIDLRVNHMVVHRLWPIAPGALGLLRQVGRGAAELTTCSRKWSTHTAVYATKSTTPIQALVNQPSRLRCGHGYRYSCGCFGTVHSIVSVDLFSGIGGKPPSRSVAPRQPSGITCCERDISRKWCGGSDDEVPHRVKIVPPLASAQG